MHLSVYHQEKMGELPNILYSSCWLIYFYVTSCCMKPQLRSQWAGQLLCASVPMSRRKERWKKTLVHMTHLTLRSVLASNFEHRARRSSGCLYEFLSWPFCSVQDTLVEQLEFCVDYLWKSERYELIADINKPVIAVFEKRRDFKAGIFSRNHFHGCA